MADNTNKKKQNDDKQPNAGTTHKSTPNAGSGGFNQGTEQDEEMNGGVADGTNHPEEVSQEKQNPRAKLDEKNQKG